MAVVVPRPEDFPRIYAELVAVAGSHSLIQSTSDTPTLGLIVADDVYDRWLGSEESEPATPKRRGRPPKNPAPVPEESSPVTEETSP